MKKLLTFLFVMLVIAAFAVPTYAGRTVVKDQMDFYDAQIRKLDVTQGLIRGGVVTTGKIWYVDSGVTASGDGTSSENAFKTIDEGNNAVTASSGDVVVVAEGHAENIIAATTFAADTTGVYFLGLGHGSNRPTLTWATATTACVTVSGSNVVFDNFIFNGTGVDAVVKMFNLSGNNIKFKNCKTFIGKETSANTAITAVTFEDSADDHIFEACAFLAKQTYEYTNTTASALSYSEATDHGKILGCTFEGAYATAMIASAVTNTNIDIGADNSFKPYSPGVPNQTHGVSTTFHLSDWNSLRTVELFADPIAGATTKTVFNIIGGPIMVKSLSGIVTTVLETQANDMSLVIVPDAAGLAAGIMATDIASALETTGDLAGSMMTIGDFAGALANSGTTSGKIGPTDGQEFYLHPGRIEVKTVADSTGAISWTLQYWPLSSKTLAF